MAQTMQSTVPAEGRLVVIPLPREAPDGEVLDAVEAFLAGQREVPHCAALVTWDDDGDLRARDIEPDRSVGPAGSSPQPLQLALGALLSEVFGTTVRASWDGSERSRPVALVDELSMSFLREVHDFVSPKTSFVALLTDWVDPGAIVRALRHIHGLRVIYGGVPSLWTTKSV